MWRLDITHTSHTFAATGIQQVCRAIAARWPQEATVVFDRYAGRWRTPDRHERARLQYVPGSRPPRSRGSRWNRTQKIRGTLAKWTRSATEIPGDGLFCPEIFDPNRDSALFSPRICPGNPRVALFHDAIALKFSQQSPRKTVDRFPEYLRKLASFDHVIAVSQSSRKDLIKFWDRENIHSRPDVSVIPLGLPHHDYTPRARESFPEFPRRLLMVGTLEARKNHLALLEACEALWYQGSSFELDLAGMDNRETGKSAVQKVRSLQHHNHPVTWHGPVSGNRLAELYQKADIVVYPSLHEGFGLPVYEALAHSIPVLTSNNSALKEAAQDGGCHLCEPTQKGIQDALYQLLHDPHRYAQLIREAQARPVRTMDDFVRDLDQTLSSLNTP